MFSLEKPKHLHCEKYEHIFSLIAVVNKDKHGYNYIKFLRSIVTLPLSNILRHFTLGKMGLYVSFYAKYGNCGGEDIASSRE